MAPALPGFINAVDPSIKVPKGAQEIFYLAYIEGFALAGFWTTIMPGKIPITR
jgi:NCS1 family nucleobase:cation symporter-1